MKLLSVTNRKAQEKQAELFQMRHDAEMGNLATFQRMTLCDRYHIGDQWKEEDWTDNNSDGKFALTINQIMPTVMQLTGDEVQNPRDITAHPLKGTNATRARLVSGLIKHAMDEQYYNRKSSRMFENGTITGRGYNLIDIDFSNGDPTNGNLSLSAPNPFMCLPDPGSMAYDYNSMQGLRYFWHDEWIDKDLLHTWFPKRKNDLGGADYGAANMGFMAGVWGTIKDTVSRLWEGADNSNAMGLGSDYRDTSMNDSELTEEKLRYKYRVSTCWERQWVKGAYIKYVDSGQIQVVYTQADVNREIERTQRTREQVQVIEQDGWGRPIAVPKLVRHMLVGNNVYLMAIEDPFNGVADIPAARFAPYFRNGYEYGVVQNIIGPQDATNWSWSMVMNMTKGLANQGWKVRSLLPSRKGWLEANGKKDGVVIDESEFGGRVEKLDQNQYPAGFDLISEKSMGHITLISNTRRDDPAFNRKDVPGVVLAMEREASQTGSSSPQMYYAYTREMIGRFVMESIIHTNTYTLDEIESVIDEQDLIDPQLLEKARQVIMIGLGIEDLERPEPPNPALMAMVQGNEPDQLKSANVATQAIAIYQEQAKQFDKMMAQVDAEAMPMAKEMLLDEVSKLSEGRYGLRVALSSASLTKRHSTRLETMELHKTLVETGVPGLSRNALIDASDITNKEQEKANPQPVGAT